VTGPEHVSGAEPAIPHEATADAEPAFPPTTLPPTVPPPAVPPPAVPPPPAQTPQIPPPPAQTPAQTPVPTPLPPPSPDPGDADPAAPPTVPAPRLDDRERSLDPRMVQVWRAFSALRLVPLVLIGTATGVFMLDGWGWLIGLALLSVLGVSLLWYQPARYARWRWRLTDLALELRRGVVVHQQATVPYFRIQQIDVIQGPIDRLLGLAALQVTTASASGSVALPGIPAADAPAVRAELLARAAEAVREHPGEVADAV
jgi:uncharacterized protein